MSMIKQFSNGVGLSISSYFIFYFYFLRLGPAGMWHQNYYFNITVSHIKFFYLLDYFNVISKD